MEQMDRSRIGARLTRLLLAIGICGALVACGTGGGGAQTRTVTLRELNDSGVSGSAVLTDLGSGRTRVDVAVDAAGHADQPAHIHPGTCDTLVPQPRYPLENVREGRSTTEVPAPLDELTRGDVAINLHRSNDDMATYTACGEIR